MWYQLSMNELSNRPDSQSGSGTSAEAEPTRPAATETQASRSEPPLIERPPDMPAFVAPQSVFVAHQGFSQPKEPIPDGGPRVFDAAPEAGASVPNRAEAAAAATAPRTEEVTPAVIASAITKMMADTQPGGAAPTGPADASGAEPASAQPRSNIGVLLVNLGTPDAAEPEAVRRYLREFLSDPRVIEEPTPLFRIVLKLLILPLRPMRKARSYRKIWNKEQNESPLKTITRAQAEKLADALAAVDGRIKVDWAMRYGNPPIAPRIEALKAQGCDRIVVLPLYPQYSAATTATVGDEVFRKLMRMRDQPAVRIAPAYYDDPVYIEALASSVQAELARLDFAPDVILASYHGMPKAYVDKGDPYLRQCVRTTELLRTRLGRGENELMMSFQSRFGRAEWLQPYTDATIRTLAKRGVKKLAVITPGFSADCLETLEEIAIESAHVFKRKRGEKFVFIPCLNDSEAGMLVLRQLALRELKGWI